jgi:hypothetical protein
MGTSQPRFQYSLVTLISVVLYGGGWCATLFSLTDAIAVAINTTVFLTFLTSIVLAISNYGQARVFWLGFSLCGCFFNIYVLVPGNNFLVTTYLIRYIHERGPDSPFWSDWSVEVYRLTVTANALISILVGGSSGLLACYCHSRRRGDPTEVQT